MPGGGQDSSSGWKWMSCASASAAKNRSWFRLVSVSAGRCYLSGGSLSDPRVHTEWTAHLTVSPVHVDAEIEALPTGVDKICPAKTGDQDASPPG